MYGIFIVTGAKKMNTIEKTIIKAKNKACKELGLPSIKIIFNYDSKIYLRVKSDNMGIIDTKYSIYIDVYELLQYVKIKSDLDLFKIIPINSICKRIKFIIYHEVSHYLQFKKYNKFSNNCLDNSTKDINSLTSREYRQLKLEKYADRIALHLVNKGI